MMNEAFGWAWICLGIVSGLLLGLGFLREGFIGGYDDPRRRLVRLGHIAFFGLGILNILFDLSVGASLDPTPSVRIASIALIVAGISMPLTCGLVAWRQSLFPLFVVPVLSALLGAGVTLLEVLP